MTWTSAKFWIAAVSETGSKHRVDAAPCEDSHFVGRDGDSFVLVACDGAGSRSHAALGSSVVASAVGELLIKNAAAVMCGEVEAKAVLAVAKCSLESLRDLHGGSVDDYATTLVALLVHDGEMITCHLGDGAIYILEREHPRLLSPPQRDGRGTYFVTTDGVRPRMWKRRLEPWVTGFLVTTDGASTLSNPVTGEVSRVVGRVVNQLDLGSEEESHTALRNICQAKLSAATDDDITLVAARRAFVAGRYGCPECFWPRLIIGKARTIGAYYCKCVACGHQVFYMTDPDRIRIQRALHKAESDAHKSRIARASASGFSR